jgi:hypothetical protein
MATIQDLIRGGSMDATAIEAFMCSARFKMLRMLINCIGCKEGDHYWVTSLPRREVAVPIQRIDERWRSGWNGARAQARQDARIHAAALRGVEDGAGWGEFDTADITCGEAMRQ